MQGTTYIVRGKNFNAVWVFKYHLNGLLASFEILEGELTINTKRWLFNVERFPYTENDINGWNCIKNLIIEKDEPDYSFEMFMKVYNYPVKNQMALRAWNKTNRADQIAAIKAVPAYDGYLQRKGTAKAMPSTYLNQKYYNDNFNAIH